MSNIAWESILVDLQIEHIKAVFKLGWNARKEYLTRQRQRRIQKWLAKIELEFEKKKQKDKWKLNGNSISKGLHGNTTVGTSGNQSVNINITYDVTLANTNYKLIGSILSSVNNTDTFIVSFKNLSITGCVATVFRVDATSGWSDASVRISWLLIMT